MSGLVLLLLLLSTASVALKHSFHAHKGSSLIGPVGVPFGFLEGGHFTLTVSNFQVVVATGSQMPESIEPGFFLQKYKNEMDFHQNLELIRSNSSLCVFQQFRSEANADDVLMSDDDETAKVQHHESADNGIFLSLKNKKLWKPYTPSMDYTFQSGEEGLYFLVYQVYPYDPKIRSNFDLQFDFYNVDRHGHKSYLTAGEMCLPTMYGLFAVSYFLCAAVWWTNLRTIRLGHAGHFTTATDRPPTIYAIHHLMSVLILLKFFSVLLESVRYHFISAMGHAEVWSVVYYAVQFIKGTFLFTIILLIGSGWSIIKPYLNDREKKVVLAVMMLQFLNNIALTVLSQGTQGEVRFERWTAVFHLVDILCCCAVLFPLVWQVNALEKSVGSDDTENAEVEEEQTLEVGEKGDILQKLQKFRAFYLIVVAYIYATRILVYLFASMLDYRSLWIRYFAVEVVTLAFYVIVGLMFRPVVDSGSYQKITRTDEGVDVELPATKRSE